MRSPGWKTRASSSTSTSRLNKTKQLVARPSRLCGEHDLEFFLAPRAPYGRCVRRVRRDVEVLTRDEARPDFLVAERTRDLVVGESASIDRDPTAFVDLLHAASLGACKRSPRRVGRRSRARRRRSRSVTSRRISLCAPTMGVRSSSRLSAVSASCSRSSHSRFPIPETARLPR